MFAIEGNSFMIDGKPIRLLSGAMHYFRIVPGYWRDRLLKLKACGLNTVETYVAWNVHEPREGEFRFDGMADVAAFIEAAGDLGLHVIVRPSPYICAEWEFGGLPAWLLADSGMQLRCSDPAFLKKVDAYYDELIPRLKPLLRTNGGPIIAVQIENEYGSYGNDAQYLKHLEQALRKRGIDVPLFTSDGPTDALLQGGSVPGVLATANFGSQPVSSFAKLQDYQPEGPLMCMEYWNGWFDHWGKPHHTRDAEEAAKVLDEMLAAGASVNFYMFHGGTNFGFYNGANCQERDLYEPTATSYDYDAPLDETGQPTAKYAAVREVIGRYAELGPLELPPAAPRHGYGKVELSEEAELFRQLDALSFPIRSATPLTMEKAGQAYGFILYSTTVSGPRPAERLTIQDVRDRALVFVDGVYQGVIERAQTQQTLMLEIPAGGARLDILVENMGRINYGPYLRDCKGITEGVRLGFQFLFDWTIRPLPLEDLSKLNFTSGSAETQQQEQRPRFYRGTFQVDACADTFLNMAGWTKGVAFLNGFNLGRYWSKGPQQTLYVPAPLLREGSNEIILFELHAALQEASVTLTGAPILDSGKSGKSANQ
ncbi:glycoside hydrolase family 35 protein [Paenibacillus silvisoli]|uniref:glycoside hydrolase family 35 protein n=1 Tax=Paenibacillus silvisoli TaxID=3110539 RepID=UPI0028040EEE|nr:beta-galactosidase [Paenibacillus silvisoli]